MLTGESSLYAEARRAGIDVGMTALPHYDDVYAAKPADVLADGAGLWVLAGHKKDEDKLAARFMTFLLRPEVQKEWVHATSYLPMTPGAVSALRDSGIPHNLLDAAQKRLSVSKKGSTRARHGPVRDRLHEFLGEEVAFVWTTDRPAKEALDNTVRRVNEAIVPVVLPAKPAAGSRKP
jgi:sn-glycerol 3-phosphate transport system substrate-binding protein